MKTILGRSRTARLLNLVLAILVLATGSVALAAVGRDDSNDAPPATAKVERGVVVSTVSADGNVEPPRDLSLGFESGGRVTDVAVKEGEPVRRGQLLARLDDRSARARLGSADRGLDSARERLRDTRAGRTVDELDRNRRTLDQSRVSVDRAERDLASARRSGSTNVAGLRRAVRRARVTGERAQVESSRVRLAREQQEVQENGLRYRRLESAVDDLRVQLEVLRDRQRDQTNSQTEASLRRSDLEARLSQARSDESSAEARAQAAQTSMNDEDRMDAEQDQRDAERKAQQLQDELDDARRDELEGSQNVNDLDFQIQSLQTRIAATERDESTAKGDLDSSKATVRQYVSEVDQGETSLREAKRNLGSQRDSLANGVEQARGQIDQARSALTSGQAALRVSEASNRVDESGADASQIASDRSGVASAAATVEDARQALEDTALRAPADGVASRVDAKEGEIVGASGPSLGAESTGASASGTSSSESSSSSSAASGDSSSGGAGAGGSSGAGSGGVVTLTQLSNLEVKAGFSETDAARVKVGDSATVSVDALPDEKISARVASIDPVETLVDNVVTYDVTFVLEAYPPDLRPGMTASADVIVDESNDAITVPKAAVRSPGGSNPTATVLRRDGRQEARLVVIGLEGDSSIEIVGGLGEGERVVVPGGDGR